MRKTCLTLIFLVLALTTALSAPILSTDHPIFPIRTCAGKTASVPFEAVPADLVGRAALLEAYLANINPDYATDGQKIAGGKKKNFPSFRGIGATYEKWCSAYGVRWDWAFVQMLHETNFLRYTGSVMPDSYNFAGLAAVHETALGERFANMERGVKAHCQHLAAYALLELPQKKCGPNDGEKLDCLEADRTLSVMERVIQYNVCKQFGRPAQFDELGPDDVGPCTERRVKLRGTLMIEKICPNDIVRWASGPLATDYSRTLKRFYDDFLEKLATCKALTVELIESSEPHSACGLAKSGGSDKLIEDSLLEFCLSHSSENTDLKRDLSSRCALSTRQQ